MRKTLGTFYENVAKQDKGLSSEIELLCDEAGQVVRGGDKDSILSYEEENIGQKVANWFIPTILLNL
jgi:hypothetical protein